MTSIFKGSSDLWYESFLDLLSFRDASYFNWRSENPIRWPILKNPQHLCHTWDVEYGDPPAYTPAPAHQAERDRDQLGQGDDHVDQEAAQSVERVGLLPPPGAAQGGGGRAAGEDHQAWQ